MLERTFRGTKRAIKKIWMEFVRDSSLQVIKVFPYPEPSPQKKEVLILRLDGIGDTVVFSGCLLPIREKYKDYVLKVIVRNYVGDLLKHCTSVDAIVPIRIQQFVYNPLYRISFVRKLIQSNPDVIIYPMWGRPEIGDELCKALRAKEVYAFGSRSSDGLAQKDWHTVDVPRTCVRELDRYVYFMKLLGIDTDANSIFPTVWISDEERKRAQSRLQQDGASSYVVLVPGAGSKNRIWPVTSWTRLVQALLQKTEYHFILVGNQKDWGICDAICRALNSKRIKNYCSLFTLSQLGGVLESALLCVGGETGPIHIAAAVGTPVVCLIGGGHFGRFFPYGDDEKNRIVYKKMECYGCNWNCIYETTRCIEEISVESTLEQIRYVLHHKTVVAV
jgi:ADP-heptose:LPS heptosyltransferase